MRYVVLSLLRPNKSRARMDSEVCVGGVLLRDNKILLGKRSPDRQFYPGLWDIVGGHRQHNESLEQCLSREPKEEVDVTPTEFRHIAEFNDPLCRIDGRNELHVYLVTEWTGVARNLLPDEHSQLEWFEIEEACHLQLAYHGYPRLFRSLAGQ